MKIPKKFKLFGQTIKVIFDKNLLSGHGDLGQARYRVNEIVLQPSTSQEPMARDKIEQIYLHELVHHIFHAIGEHSCQQDERLVDNVSQALHQYMIQVHNDEG